MKRKRNKTKLEATSFTGVLSNWKGDKGDLSVCFELCRGLYGEYVTNPVDMAIEFECCDKSGQFVTKFLTKEKLLEESDYLIKNAETGGYGWRSFLESPTVNNFVINGVLTIKCTLMFDD